MSAYSSISELLTESGAQFRIFDMGRRLSKLSTDQFAKLEQGLIPYPTPYLHHAWLALFLWHPANRTQNVVWFLKFPLDEQGYLVQAVRDDFLNRLLQNISQMLSETALNEANDALKDNPFSFTPDAEKMAMFHAQAARLTQQPASQFYQPTQAYLANHAQWDQWSQLGYQGIADVTARLDEANNSDVLAKAIPGLPSEPLVAFSTSLEHVTPNHMLANALLARLTQALKQPEQSALVAALLRGLSNIHSEAIKQQALRQTLASDYGRDAQVLVAIASRCHSTLQYPDILAVFLEQLAQSEAGQAGFSRVLADLMFIPVMRTLILQAFRQPERSDALSAAIGQMFGESFTAPTVH